MAIVSVDEISVGRDGAAPLKGAREYTRTWRVVTDSPAVGAAEVLFSASIPDWLTPYYTPTFSDPRALLVHRNAANESTESRLIWLVECKYSTEIDQFTPQKLGGPLDEVPEVNWSTASERVILYRDKNGKPFRNTADTAFPTEIEGESYYQVFRYSANRADFSPSTARGYYNAVNSDAFYGASPGQCKLVRWDGTRKIQATIGGGVEYFWRHDLEIWFREDGWKLKIPSVGPVKKVIAQSQGDGKWAAAKDPDTGESTGAVHFLSQDGTRFVDWENAYVMEFDVNQGKPFSVLGVQ